ncbi:methyl-accepting chemotaxis protein [Halorussus halophilus]|uniref:methyl-accepting chemotaxis protein n=1 Tax=Halorussus halophilus TaxID=2650975 RepID=UPI0013012651|nr:methyl-accepting chemotaxis protein [Halorussus halophilus]
MVRDRLRKILTGTRSGSDADDRNVSDADERRDVTFDGGVQTSEVSVSSGGTVTRSQLAETYRGTEVAEELQQAQAVHLGQALEDPESAAGDAADLGRRHAEAGVPTGTFAATYEASVETLVAEAFDKLEARLGDGNEAVSSEIQQTEQELQSSLSATFSDMEAGLDAYEGGSANGAGESEFEFEANEEDELNVDDDDLLDGVGVPVFMLDVKRDEVAAWNAALEQLTGVSAEEAIGKSHVSEAFYPDGRRVKTLADKVAEAPETADQQFGLTKEPTDRTLYSDESTMVNGAGEEHEIDFTAMPLYDDDGELIAVVETINDRTEERQRRRGVTSLVEELIGTLTAMEMGDLSARADFHDEHDAVDDSLLEVVSQVNAIAERFETLTERVGEQTDELESSVEGATESARIIEERVDEQTDQLSQVATQMENFSASMQEVAASSDQVASAAEQAKASADSGLDSSEGAREATDEVIEMSEDLVGTVTELESQMNEIEEVVEVIAEVADQTNLLALNANIEAARAGEAGSGFEVVADEVKQLANETREHTEEIATRIEDIQSQANETVVAVEESNEQVKHAGEEIEDALVALEEIADAVEEAATGVTEVAQANDEQASNVEQVMATVEDVRDQTREVETATEDIVDATREQTDAIGELANRVDEMRNA